MKKFDSIFFVLFVLIIFVPMVVLSVNSAIVEKVPVRIIDLDVYVKCSSIKYVNYPSISDDGSKVVFIAQLEYASENDENVFLDYNSAEIFAVNSDGSDLKQVTNSTLQGVFPILACSISGDGSKIVFTGKKDATSTNPRSGIFIVNSDGSDLKQLTNLTSYSSPSISNDGSKVAFTTKSDGATDLFVVNSDGTGLKQLTSNALEVIWPNISGDGTKIVFLQHPQNSNPEVFVVNFDGTELKQLTSSSLWDYSPSISDDGNKIAFISSLDDIGELFVINSDGSGLKQLTDKKLDSGSAYSSLSGDGSTIIVRSSIDKGSEYGLFMVNSDGSSWQQLETKMKGLSYPILPWSLSRDGSKIVFLEQEYDDLPRIFVANSDVSSIEPDIVIEYLGALILIVVAIAVLIIFFLRRKKLRLERFEG